MTSNTECEYRLQCIMMEIKVKKKCAQLNNKFRISRDSYSIAFAHPSSIYNEIIQSHLSIECYLLQAFALLLYALSLLSSHCFLSLSTLSLNLTVSTGTEKKKETNEPCIFQKIRFLLLVEHELCSQTQAKANTQAHVLTSKFTIQLLPPVLYILSVACKYRRVHESATPNHLYTFKICCGMAQCVAICATTPFYPTAR